MIRALTVFALCENVHLTKDVGMIPYILQKDFDYDCTIASYSNGDYPSLETDVKGLKHTLFAKKTNNPTIDSLLFICSNFRKYDLLQAYHLTRGSVLILSVFKLLKKLDKKGITYLKLDAGEELKDFKYRGITGRIFRFLISKIDIISTETKELYETLNANNILQKKVNYIPNGFYPKSEAIRYEEKQNIILTVGRIGTQQKASEILLKAFSFFYQYNKDWILEFVGPIEDHFKETIETFYREHPDLVNQVKFHGNISNKVLLKNKYDAAKLFVLTSRWESFGLVLLEAMNSGCTIISTDLMSAKDVTDNGLYGEKFKIDDYQALSEILLRKANDEEYLRNNTMAIQEYAKKKFYWPDIVKQINDLIESELSRN